MIVSPQGHVVTNAHVITDPRTGEPMQEVVVQLSGGVVITCLVIGFDHSTDIAVLKIDATEQLPLLYSCQ